MFPIIVLLAELVLCIVAFAQFGFVNGCGALLLIVFTIVFFYYAAKNKQQATFVEEGTIEFVTVGKTLLFVFENIRGWHYQRGPGWFPIPQRQGKEKWVLVEYGIVPDGRGPEARDPVYAKEKKRWEDEHPPRRWWPFRRTVPEKNAPSKINYWPPWRYLQRRWGFFWVSVFYPLVRVHTFSVVHARLKPRQLIKKDAPIEEWVEGAEETGQENGNNGGQRMRLGERPTQFLLWKFPRPIIARNIEFAGVLEGNVLVLAYFQVVIPYPLVFVFKDKFFLLLEEAVQAAVMDYVRKAKMSFSKFSSEETTGPNSPFFWDAINHINFVGIAQQARHGLLREFGVFVYNAWVIHIESAEAKEVDVAIKANEIARLEGEARKTAALAEATAIKTVADANAYALTVQLTATPNNPELVMGKLAVDIAQKRAEGNAAFAQGGGTTLVEGGGQAGIIITPTERKQPPTPPTPPARSGGSGGGTP